MKKIFTLFSMFVLMLVFLQQSIAQQISFPGAEGAGKYTSGGRGTASALTTVFEVTNLTDVNTAGSLRYACSQSISTYPNRTIVFRVSGTIHLNSKLSIQRNTTIAGQTAPGDGICIADYPVVISGDNVILRYLRVRMGDKNQLKTSPTGCGIPVAPFTAACAPIDGSGGDDALGNLGNKNIMIDHCSVSWSTDEALTVYRGDSLTMQWNLISEPLNYSYHFETGDGDFEHHGYGGIWGSLHGSFHHNLLAHCQSRNPRLGGNSTYAAGAIESADLRNNVIYDWGLYTVYGGEGGQYNLVNNYYKYGPSTGSGTMYRIVNVDSSTVFPYAKYFLSGNYVDGSTTNTNNNWSGAAMGSGQAADTVKSKVTTPFIPDYLPTTTETATAAYTSVLNGAGATLPRRDTLDRRITNDVRFRVGRTIDVQGGYAHATPYAQTVDAWPNLASTTAPIDTDHDGMPDEWESANSLNPNNAADRGIFASNGYTNLENYLNSITLTSPEIYFSGVLNNFSQSLPNSSAVQTISLSGINLAANVTVTPPLGFEVSINGSTWFTNASPLVITPVAGAIAATTLSIRLNSTVAGSISGNIVSSTTSVGNFYLKVSGTTNAATTNEPSSAVWTLLNDQTPTVTGGVTATNQAFGSGMVGVSYNSPFGGTTGWQRSATTSFLPIGYNANTYVEYSVAPATGKSLIVTSIALSALGGGTGSARMAIYYSLDGFATSLPAGTCTYNGITYDATIASSVPLLNTSTAPLTGQQVATIPTTITVAPSQTFSVRIYVWITGTGNRYFTSQNVSINGTSSDVPLPLSLVTFSAAVQNNSTQLLWKTTSETNMRSYEIERSTDARTFSYIGSVDAKNIANNNYSFVDIDNIKGVVYYRLKMINKDGTYRYSFIVSVGNRTAGSISIYPNPVVHTITITHTKQATGAVANILNSEGQKIQTVQITPGTTQTTIYAERLLKGVYMLQYLDDKQVQTLKFIKQ